MRSESGNGSGFITTDRTMLNIAALAAMQIASVSNEVIVKLRSRISNRTANRASCIKVDMSIKDTMEDTRSSNCPKRSLPMIEPGKKAPAFSLKDQDSKRHSLADYAGRPVVLFFYPKDDTSGCTKEACGFRDHLPQFKPSRAAVFGVSILDEASKAKFAAKHDLNFPLLADADHALAEKYGVW